MAFVSVVQREQYCEMCMLASILCKYDLRKGDLFVLSWVVLGGGVCIVVRLVYVFVYC